MEVLELVLAETVGQGHIGRIAATRDEDPANADVVVARIEHPPGVAEGPVRRIRTGLDKGTIAVPYAAPS